MWATPKIFAGLTWLLLCATDVSGQDVGPAIPEQVPFESALLLPPLPFSDQVPVHSILSEQFLAPPSSHLADGVSKHGDFDWSNVPVYTKVPWAGWFTTVVGGPGYYTVQEQCEGLYRSKAPPAPFGATSSYQTPTFDYDFRYLDDPQNDYHMWSDAYKRMIWDDAWLVSFGGEYRYRYNHYSNSQLSGVTDSYGYSRLRIYGDFAYRDQFRFFIEAIDARTLDVSKPFSGEIRTGTDILNGFAEWKIDYFGKAPLQLRVGRQDVLMGSQRLIASPIFSNTLRTYDGVHGFWHTGSWDVDLFWIRPATLGAQRLESFEHNRSLSGLFVTRHPSKNALIDLYLLNLNDTRTEASGNTVTLGTRVAGDVDTRLLYEVELMTQFGDRDGKTINAYSSTTGLGWQFVDLPWNISFWTYFDYASGTRDPNASKYQTFNQLFPAGRTYFGYLNLVGRQNIQDLNFQLLFSPQKWLQIRAQYHIFHLASARDALYNAVGVPIRYAPTGAAGKYVGNEIDLTADVRLTPHQYLLFGYSHLFAGRFVKETGPGSDPNYAYAQYTIRW